MTGSPKPSACNDDPAIRIAASPSVAGSLSGFPVESDDGSMSSPTSASRASVRVACWTADQSMIRGDGAASSPARAKRAGSSSTSHVEAGR